LKSIEFSDGGFHFSLLYRSVSCLDKRRGKSSNEVEGQGIEGFGDGCEDGNVHVVICPWCVGRANAGVNQAIVPVLKLRYVDRKHLIDMIRKVGFLDLHTA
jgi:hypothetical protein